MKPCAEGMNISNCRSFNGGPARFTHDFKPTPVDADSCPKCTPDKDDPDKIRRIKGYVQGNHFGLTPGRAGDQSSGFRMWYALLLEKVSDAAPGYWSSGATGGPMK
ncbi:MAG: hypothetical protein Q9200_001753 [Gallowayella weberi]